MVLDLGVPDFFSKNNIFKISPTDDSYLVFQGSRKIPTTSSSGGSFQVTQSAGTGADDAAVGTLTWSFPTLITASDTALARVNHADGETCKDNEIKIIKGGSIGTTNLGNPDVNWDETAGAPTTYYSYGGSSNLWGETWTAADINSSTFGVVLAVQRSEDSAITHYLKATNFGFSIPQGATINGITAEFQRSNEQNPFNGRYISVDHIRITIDYTVN